MHSLLVDCCIINIQVFSAMMHRNVKYFCFVSVSDSLNNVVIVVSVLVLISLVMLLVTCLCCYAAPSDDDSNDGLLLEQYSEKNPPSLSHLPSTSTIR